MLNSKIFCQQGNTGHVQGIALDRKNGHMYFSFTTRLVKTDIEGNILGSVCGLLGHLGCITFHDGRVFGSLEYKNDSIGRGILKNQGKELELKNRFFIAIFDCSKIDREDMNAETDDIMTAARLLDVERDYEAEIIQNGKKMKHRYGCSGIDGTCVGPDISIPSNDAAILGNMAQNESNYLYSAYGIYGDNSRTDNDCQVIAQYEINTLLRAAAPLSQTSPDIPGIDHPRNKFFFFTGNTTWGIQNIEYDAATRSFFCSVYNGKKAQYPNYPMFVVDGATAPCLRAIPGTEEQALFLNAVKTHIFHPESGIYGLDQSLGQTGMISLGDGYWLFAENGKNALGDNATVYPYKYENEKFIRL